MKKQHFNLAEFILTYTIKYDGVTVVKLRVNEGIDSNDNIVTRIDLFSLFGLTYELASIGSIFVMGEIQQ